MMTGRRRIIWYECDQAEVLFVQGTYSGEGDYYAGRRWFKKLEAEARVIGFGGVRLCTREHKEIDVSDWRK